MSKKNTQVNEFAAFDELEAQRKKALENAVNGAAETKAAERADKQAAEATQRLAEATEEYQAEIAAETKAAERKRTRANNKALRKANGTTGTTQAKQDGPKVVSRYAGHRADTQGFKMDEAIGVFYDANGRYPTGQELSDAIGGELDEARCRGHIGFLKRKGFIVIEEPEVVNAE